MKINAFLYNGLAASIIVLDQMSKWYVGQTFVIPCTITSFLSVYVVKNRGVAWSIFQSENQAAFFLVSFVIALLLLFLIIYTYHNYKRGESIIGETMICAGALSNLIDRFMHGGVIDFILLSYKELSWPVFNFADMAIVLGIAILLIKRARIK